MAFKYINPGYPISIHAPRMGSDVRAPAYSTSLPISIHAPRMGSDYQQGIPRMFSRNFNPRSPHGERP